MSSFKDVLLVTETGETVDEIGLRPIGRIALQRSPSVFSRCRRSSEHINQAESAAGRPLTEVVRGLDLSRGRSASESSENGTIHWDGECVDFTTSC